MDVWHSLGACDLLGTCHCWFPRPCDLTHDRAEVCYRLSIAALAYSLSGNLLGAVSQSSLFSALLLLGGFHGPAHDQALCSGSTQGLHDICLQGLAFAWIAWVFRVPTALPSMLMHRADDATSSLGCCHRPQRMQRPQVDGLAPAAPRPTDFPTLLQNVRICTSLIIVLQSLGKSNHFAILFKKS